MITSNIVKAWPFAKLQSLCALVDSLEAEGHTVGDVRAYVKAKKLALAKKIAIQGKALLRECPKCGEVMTLLGVKEEGITFVWECRKCKFSEPTDKPLRRIIADFYAGEKPVVDLPDDSNVKIEKVSERFDTPKCPQCGKKVDLKVMGKYTAWICECGVESPAMQIPIERWIEKFERGNTGVFK